MPRSPFLFAALFALGLAAAAAYFSTGAVTPQDALIAAASRGAPVLDAPLRLTTRATAIFVDAARSVEPQSALFPLVHILPGILMALVAAFSGAVAFRTARGHDAARSAAGIAVGAACLFGADLGAAGRAGGGVPTVLALLSGAAFLWIAPRPRALAGGLLVGLATAEHPLVLLVLPGFLFAALGAAIRAELPDDARILRRAAIGFALGLAAILLENGTTPGAPFLRFAGPPAWISSFVELVKTLWRAVGPIGLALALWGVRAFFRGEARHARPFLLIHFVPALAMIFLVPRDPETLRSLAAWPFLFFMVPGFCDVAARWSRSSASSRRDSIALASLAVLASGVLFTMNRDAVDRRAERGIAWARDAFDILPPNSVLLTANPVHWALVADGERPDLDVILVDRPETVRMRRSPIGLFAPESKGDAPRDAGFLHEVVAMNLPHRPIFIDPTIFFDPARRVPLLGREWHVLPYGLAFRVAPLTEIPPEEESKAAAVLWDKYDLQPGTPPAQLRDGLGGDRYYARSLLQSASLNMNMRLRRDAEREFLFALSLDAVNPNAAIFGLGRIALERQNFEAVVETIEPRVQRDREGAWLALQLLGTAYLRMGQPEKAKGPLREALQLIPAELISERKALEDLARGAEEGRRLPGRVEDPIPVPNRER